MITFSPREFTSLRIVSATGSGVTLDTESEVANQPWTIPDEGSAIPASRFASREWVVQYTGYLGVFLTADLPGTAQAGSRAHCSDVQLTSGATWGTGFSGGGADFRPVFFDGNTWLLG